MDLEQVLAPPVKIRLKQEWDGKFATRLVPFEKIPIENVRFTDTQSQLCTTAEECIAEMKRLQDIHMEKLDLGDIQYNFYICGDGSVLEGRGWNVWSFKPKEYEHLQDCCLDIAFLINLSETKLTPEMKETAKTMVEYGKSLGYLKQDCKIIDEPE